MHFTLSFALVNIPVVISPIIKNNDTRFNYLHNKCLSKVKYIKYCPVCKKEVKNSDLVKGYQYKRGEYITFSDSELDKIKPIRDKEIEIVAFVKEDEIDPWYYEKSYVLASTSLRSFNLLKNALVKTKTVGICKTVISTKFYYGILKYVDNYLVFSTIYFPEEVDMPQDIPKSNVDKKELDLAIKIIESMMDNFDNLEYRDEYGDKIKSAIKLKLKGKKVRTNKRSKNDTQINDLFKALEKSLKE